MKNTKTQRVPNCLKRHRKARGLQQKEVAIILGVKSTSMLSRWENGFCLPNALTLLKLAVLYRTMVDALYIDLLRELRINLNKREQKLLNNAQKEKKTKHLR